MAQDQSSATTEQDALRAATRLMDSAADVLDVLAETGRQELWRLRREQQEEDASSSSTSASAVGSDGPASSRSASSGG